MNKIEYAVLSRDQGGASTDSAAKDVNEMMKKSTILWSAALVTALLLTGCGADKTAQPDTQITQQPDAQPTQQADTQTAANNWMIPLSELSAEPAFFDRTQDGVAMQLIALVDADGQVHAAYNTCQVCAGSPYAYFDYENGKLVCQNCGNAFDVSSVGAAAGGCNPMPAADYRVEGDMLVIPEAELERVLPSFANWKKGL